MKADKKKVLRLLNTARGQIDGVIKMINDDKYCVDVVNQIMASSAILKKTAKDVLEGHLTSCVAESFKSGKQSDREEKIEEIIDIFSKLSK
ncbi:metal-sensing transcriptional repressor [Endomicrobium proavitum]|uniref:Copper-sensing transcriptional repressor CsoR n=1 Tax=Endomicrobium proavitum TaxID=1408281 RepID=A0A0G3WI30_9BACT|nr:metal-sensing transcriptional repressor [Endomicrobium proavitum]AKL97522.1 putative copper-sensing transcriptional repressor CsoR [Endomicrobium proavitum]